jgi:hypothetical protein
LPIWRRVNSRRQVQSLRFKGVRFEKPEALSIILSSGGKQATAEEK